MRRGQKIGYLTLLEKVFYRKNQPAWICKCECGKLRRLGETNLKTRHNTSCGCKAHTANLIHGMWKHPLYKKWDTMKRRCYNKTMDSYNRYGGRGIKVCKSWHNFKNFKNDMLESYLKHIKKYGRKNTTIERINSNKGYNPKNCKWATCKEQSRNTSYNKNITYKGKTMCVAEWAEKLGINKTLLYKRIKYNFPIEEVLFHKKRTHYNRRNGKKGY